MPAFDLLRHRLYNQHLNPPRAATPTESVAWFGAVQGQEYLGTIWSVAQRLAGPVTNADLDAAFDAGAFLRTHVMRPTWHLVAPADLRWLLALTGPRVHRLNDLYYRQGELDAPLLKRSRAVMVKALRDHHYLTRAEVQAALKQAGIDRSGNPLAYILMHAELEGLVCSGPRRGKQFTYALLEERVPPAPAITREEALAELVRRYFQSHGPAQAHDFAWWSGLTLADTKAGLDLVGNALERVTVDGVDYWLVPSDPPALPAELFLLPTFDEYGIAYKDRSAFYNREDAGKTEAGYTGGFPHFMVYRGRVIGLWRRTLTKKTVQVETQFWRDDTPATRRAFTAAAQRYAAFLRLTLIMP